MKRAAIFGMVVVVIALAWTYLPAQSTWSAQPSSSSTPATVKAAVPAAGASAQGLVAAPPQTQPPLNLLQQRYVDLATKQARLMTTAQLEHAVSQLDIEVQELNAWSKVEETARQLHEVIDKHPQTQAAEAARSALKVIEENRYTAGKQHEKERPHDREKFERSPFGAESSPRLDSGG
jgi:hypothetical protein